jgi:hypothetical protein
MDGTHSMHRYNKWRLTSDLNCRTDVSTDTEKELEHILRKLDMKMRTENWIWRCEPETGYGGANRKLDMEMRTRNLVVKM